MRSVFIIVHCYETKCLDILRTLSCLNLWQQIYPHENNFTLQDTGKIERRFRLDEIESAKSIGERERGRLVHPFPAHVWRQVVRRELARGVQPARQRAPSLSKARGGHAALHVLAVAGARTLRRLQLRLPARHHHALAHQRLRLPAAAPQARLQFYHHLLLSG